MPFVLILGGGNEGFGNTAVGTEALGKNQTGALNTAVGHWALHGNTTGAENAAYGSGALIYSTGSGNIGVGRSAGCELVTGDNNIYIGSSGANNDSKVIRIGASGAVNSAGCEFRNPPAQTSTYIAGIANSTLAATDTPKAVYITTNGRLGLYTPPTPAPTPSSERFKKDINSLGFTRHEILRLRPVSFRYKQADEKGDYPLQYGLIAEEVAKVLPELVAYDKDGAPLAVHYHLLAPLLLGELQRQETENQRLAQEVAALRAQAADQAARMESLERRFTSLPRLTQTDTR